MRQLLHHVVLLLVAALAAGPAPAAAEPPRIPAFAGDGAAGCAEAKSALASRPGRATRSVASANFDVTYYHLDLAPDLDASLIAGTVRVEGVVSGSPLAVLTLDLAPSMIVSAVALGDGTPLAHTHSGGALHITLPATVNPGVLVTVDVTYSGTPVVQGFGNFVFGTRGTARFGWSLSEPYGAREWWPCKDHPSDKADSLRVTVTVPSQYRVGSQGLLVSETPSIGMITYDWVSRYPIASYLVSLAIGDYSRYTGTYTRPAALAARFGPLTLPLEHLVYNDSSFDLPQGWANVTDQFEVFEDWFGPYPFGDEKYGHAEFTFGGGMEHQTMSSMGGSAPGLVSHELAHQWYGDSISPKQWPHLWLNEGFATYAEFIYWEAREDSFPGAAAAVYAGRYSSARRATGTLVLADTSSVSDMFDGNRVYAKGSIVLHMLRWVVGDAVFRDIMAAWAADPSVQYGVAETADFQRVAETESGLDLDAFFRQWVTDGTGYPTYGLSAYWQAEGGQYRVWATVGQSQQIPESNVPLFVMPLEIAVQTTAGEERVRVQNDRSSQVFEFTVAARPTRVILDPDRWILRADMDTVATAPVPSYPTILSLAPNPARDTITLSYTVNQGGTLAINVYDVRGRRVLTEAAVADSGVQSQQIDTAPLATGVYFLRMDGPGGQAARKFVVLR